MHSSVTRMPEASYTPQNNQEARRKIEWLDREMKRLGLPVMERMLWDLYTETKWPDIHGPIAVMDCILYVAVHQHRGSILGQRGVYAGFKYGTRQQKRATCVNNRTVSRMHTTLGGFHQTSDLYKNSKS